MGELTDFITGEIKPDTHDERYRQAIARLLIEKKGYSTSEIIQNQRLRLHAGNRKAELKIDFLITLAEKVHILIKYAPGSLVTRRLSTLALSRIVEPYQVPIVVITNGEDAEIMDGQTGKVVATGMANIPGRKALINPGRPFMFNTIESKVSDQASRIAFACEIDGACPCDSDICIIE